MAAYQAFKEGKADKIILTGESTVGAPEYSTTDFLKEFLVSKGVPGSSIEVYSNLQNSAEQLQKIKEVQGQNDKFLIISLGFHTKRVKVISDSEEIQAEHQVAEDLLKKRNKKYEGIMQDWNKSKGLKSARKLEAILTPLSRYELARKFLNLITALKGTRKPLTAGEFPRKPKKGINT